jgi:Raf kinase inhibitor-like YbhB/YbcL family protein
MLRFLAMGWSLCLMAVECLGAAQAAVWEDTGPMSMQLSSPAFLEGGTIPTPHTADGQDTSPKLRWAGVPAEAKSLALVCDDPDAPRGIWVHWVLFNLPPEMRVLPEGVPTKKSLPGGAKQGTNDFGKIGYGGPSPPPGKPHRYYFKVYSLDRVLDLSEGATKQQLVDAMKGHILAEGQLMGRYGR